MHEIFNKAREYARLPMSRSNFRRIETELKEHGDVGGWRLHHQAYKVMKIAEQRCMDRRLMEPPHDEPLNMADMIGEINTMEVRYGQGWSREGDWQIKDYKSPADLIDTLIFLRSMGIKYIRQDSNDLRQAVHLRVSNEDFDLIFNPIADIEHARGRGHG